MNKITEVVDTTISNLKNKKIDPTPNAYQKEFCEVAQDFKVSCRRV